MEESNRHTKVDPLRLARRRLAPLELASLEGEQHLVASAARCNSGLLVKLTLKGVVFSFLFQHLVAKILQLLLTALSAVCPLRSVVLRWFVWSSACIQDAMKCANLA